MQKSGLVYTAGMATGKLNDAKAMDDLIRVDDRTVFADKGYINEKRKRAARRVDFNERKGNSARQAPPEDTARQRPKDDLHIDLTGPNDLLRVSGGSVMIRFLLR